MTTINRTIAYSERDIQRVEDGDEFPSDALLHEISQTLALTAAEYDRSGDFPHDNLQFLHRHHLLGLTIDKSAGGQQADLATARKVIAAIARGEPSTALIVAMQYLQHLELNTNTHWPAELKQRVQRGAIEHGELINALRVEPDLGTPHRGGRPATIAYRHGDHWSISGVKRYSTGFPGLSWLKVWAISDDPEPVAGYWLVPTSAEGISIGERWDHLGMRATNSHDIHFKEVIVPLDHAVEVKPFGQQTVQSPLQKQWHNVLLSALYDAVAHSGRDAFRDWLLERIPSNLGAPLATLPRFQQVIGQIDGLLLNNRALLDAGVFNALDLQETDQLKRLVCAQSIKAVEIAIEASGNPGLSHRSPLQRHYRDVLCARIHTPQDDSVLIGAGRAALKV